MPAFSRLKYSWITSLMVVCDSFIVNCCAPVGPAQNSAVAAAMKANDLTMVRIVASSQWLWCSTSSLGEQNAHADERDIGNVGDQPQPRKYPRTGNTTPPS